ncbi:MAG: hypothetical protein ACRD82_00155 [Blastocatellia bacterium]
MPSYPLNRLQFEQRKVAGDFNPQATYDDYLAMIREREQIRRETEEAARRDGYELGAPELDMSPEDEAALDRAWEIVAANYAAEKEPLVAERAA